MWLRGRRNKNKEHQCEREQACILCYALLSYWRGAWMNHAENEKNGFKLLQPAIHPSKLFITLS